MYYIFKFTIKNFALTRQFLRRSQPSTLLAQSGGQYFFYSALTVFVNQHSDTWIFFYSTEHEQWTIFLDQCRKGRKDEHLDFKNRLVICPYIFIKTLDTDNKVNVGKTINKVNIVKRVKCCLHCPNVHTVHCPYFCLVLFSFFLSIHCFSHTYK